MNKGKICAIIAMVSVLVMFVWGYVQGTFKYSWLAVFAGGIAIVAVSMLMNDNNDNDDKGSK